MKTADMRDKGKPPGAGGGEFLSAVTERRRRAREHMDEGAVTETLLEQLGEPRK